MENKKLYLFGGIKMKIQNIFADKKNLIYLK